MQLKTGKNKIRIIGDPEKEKVHWITSTSPHARIKKEICSGDNTCPHCPLIPTSTRYSFPIIDRADGKVKILSTGALIYLEIEGLVLDAMWGDPTKYDIVINRIWPAGTSIIYARYNVMGVPPFGPIVGHDRVKADTFFLARTAGDEADIDQNAGADTCKSCGGDGEIRGMSCICEDCGTIIWGC